jgi:hypothetical protein
MAKVKVMSPLALLLDLLKDPDRKPVLKMIKEIIYLFFVYRCFPRQYFSAYLFKKWRTNVKDFFPCQFLYDKIKPFINENDAREVLENKLYFDFFYSQFNISLPEIFMYNHRKMFVAGNKTIEINSIKDFKSLLEEMFKQDPSNDSVIVKRTYWSFGGDKIFKIYADQITKEPLIIEELYTEVIKSGFLFQKTVKQHPEFINPDGKIEILSGYLRMSIANLHVDNISSGGCFVGIDLNTGKLKKIAYLTFKYYGVKVLTAHPETGTVFENFTVPLFSEAKEFVLRTARFIPGLRLVGWDVAIGESGPVLIEGNSDYDISGNDIADGGYRANPVFRKVLHELNYI